MPAARADDVDDLLDGLGPEPPPAGAGQVEARPEEAVTSAPAVEHVIAGPGRRLLGAAVDGALWTSVSAGLSYTVLPHDEAAFALDATMVRAIAAYEIVSVATWGRTLGKLIAGTRVVASDSGGTPRWSQAVLRWAVPSIAALVFLVLGDGLAARMEPVVSAFVTIVVYVGVLRDPLRQGLHDKGAGTVVVLARPAGEDALDHPGTSSLDAVPPAR